MIPTCFQLNFVIQYNHIFFAIYNILEFSFNFRLLGTLSPGILRGKLRTALRMGDNAELESVIIECVAAGMPELDSDIHRARDVLEDFHHRKKGSENEL